MYKSKISLFLVSFIIFLGFLWSVVIDNEKRNIKKHSAFTVGRVVEVKPKKGGEKIIAFEFSDGKSNIYARSLLSMCLNLSRNIEDKFFPVIYNSKNSQQARILITEESFKRFDQPFPDSLFWVKDICP